MSGLILGQQPEDAGFDVGGMALRVSAGLVFLALGYVKLFPGEDSMWIKTFDTIGFGRWLLTLTGAMQAAAGALFLFPRTAVVGGLLAGATMLGAVIAQIAYLGGAGDAVIPGAVLLFVVVVTFRVRRSRT